MGDGLAAVVDVEFGVEVVDVCFDGGYRDVEFVGDFAVGEVGGEVAQDACFAVGEGVW